MQWLDFCDSESDTDNAKADDEKMLGGGSDEDDSLLVIYQEQEPSSAYWQHRGISSAKVIT